MRLILLFLACSISHILFSQSSDVWPEWKLMVGATYTYPTFIEVINENRRPKYSYAVFGSVTRPFAKRLTGEIRMGFEPKGAKLYFWNEFVNPPATYSGTVTEVRNYISFSTMVRWQPLDRLPIYVGAAPVFSYLVYAKDLGETYLNGNYIGSSAQEIDMSMFKDNRRDFGLISCIGYRFPLSEKFAAGLEVYWNQSLLKIQDLSSERTYRTFGLMASFSRKR